MFGANNHLVLRDHASGSWDLSCLTVTESEINTKGMLRLKISSVMFLFMKYEHRNFAYVPLYHHYIFIISQPWLISHLRSTVVLLDTGTPSTSKEIYGESGKLDSIATSYHIDQQTV